MDRADLITELTRIEIAINKLEDYSFESSEELQKLLGKFRSFHKDYIRSAMPDVEGFDHQLYEIEKNVTGLTSDNKGRDLEVYKSNTFDKSRKDLTIFINIYKDHLGKSLHVN
jgi:hypothetical protein